MKVWVTELRTLMTGWLLHLTASLSRLWHFDLLQRDSTPSLIHENTTFAEQSLFPLYTIKVNTFISCGKRPMHTTATSP